MKMLIEPALLRFVFGMLRNSVIHAQTHTHTRRHICVLIAQFVCNNKIFIKQTQRIGEKENKHTYKNRMHKLR